MTTYTIQEDGRAIERMQAVLPRRGLLRPRWWWVTGGCILAGGLAIVAVLEVLGYLWHQWPAHYLNDDQPGTWLSASALWLGGGCTLLKAMRTRGGARRLWLVLAVTLMIAAADDLHRWHERTDLWIHALFGADPTNPITTRIDDLLVALYGVVACAVGWSRREALYAEPRALWCFIAAGALFGWMVVCDIAHLSQTVEDTLKTVSALLILIGSLGLLCENPRA
jgi:hypothetical protein